MLGLQVSVWGGDVELVVLGLGGFWYCNFRFGRVEVLPVLGLGFQGV